MVAAAYGSSAAGINWGGTGSLNGSPKTGYAGSTGIYVRGSDGLIALHHTAPTALLDLAASTTARASLRIRSGTAPTSPNDGDVWSDGSDLKVRLGGTTYTLQKA